MGPGPDTAEAFSHPIGSLRAGCFSQLNPSARPSWKIREATRITIADAYLEMDKTTFRLFQARIVAGAVTCTIEGRDRYNRTLGICYTAGGTESERLAG